ncbi:MAG: sensor domain-containing diguanylate cyclase [Thermodesulfobacteriota bacterium]
MAENTPATHQILSWLELGKALTSELSSERLFSRILQKVSELLPAENWSLLLADESTGELRFELSVDLDHETVKDVRLAPGQGIAGRVALEQRPLVVEDVRNCDFFFGEVDRLSGQQTRSVICVPLIFGGKTLGVIEVVNPRVSQDHALPLLSIIADYAAIAVENMRRYREIQNLAVHDDLTGLYNTRFLYKKLAELIAESGQTGEPFSLIFMDIDNFKAVVDTYGHLLGSQTLQEVASTIRSCLTEPAFAVAYGGDEFVVVLKGFGREAARLKAEEIGSRLKNARYLAQVGHGVSLTASLGIATYPDDAVDVKGLLALADHAMFDVKAKGKNAVKSA